MIIRISSKYENNNLIREFTKNLPERFEKEGTLLFFERNTIKRFVVDHSDPVLSRIIVKRYRYPNFFQRISYSFFRSTKARRAFLNAERLRQLGINTPVEIAYVEQWSKGLFAYGFYLSDCDDAPPIREKMIEPENFDRIMAADFADFAVKLHEAGILNHDLNSTNVLYHPDGDHYYFSLIDINRINFFPEGKEISREDCFENLTRFTGRMDLFEYVVRCYVEKRGWDIEPTTKEAIEIKKKHDLRWKQRKAFLRKLTFRK